MGNKNTMQEKVEKGEADHETKVGEQGTLMDVGPENKKEIVEAVQIYKRHQHDRIVSLKKECEWKEKIKALVKESDLLPQKDGTIKFNYDKVIIEITPRDELITIKEKKPKKPKKAKKKHSK